MFIHALEMGLRPLLHTGICSEQNSLSFEGGSFVLVTAEKWNKDNGLRRSLGSPNPEDEA